jgi:hypothetical protein
MKQKISNNEKLIVTYPCYGAFGVAGDSGVLDNDCIKLDILLFSSNQIV